MPRATVPIRHRNRSRRRNRRACIKASTPRSPSVWKRPNSVGCSSLSARWMVPRPILGTARSGKCPSGMDRAIRCQVKTPVRRANLPSRRCKRRERRSTSGLTNRTTRAHFKSILSLIEAARLTARNGPITPNHMGLLALRMKRGRRNSSLSVPSQFCRRRSKATLSRAVPGTASAAGSSCLGVS